uniref:Rho GTPase-activating protein 11A n=2 Tax=Lygus hesperus TaxID=30085 RepID=A0A0A9VV41_LYGHE
MYIDETYLEEIREEVIKLLKAAGVKHGLKKQDLKPEDEDDIKVYKVFQTSLGLLEKERVMTNCDQPIDVPVFVIDACQFIKKDLTIEGLFRKAGSAAKQRELKILLDCGNRLDLNDDQTIINVANTLKMFFRELPEPLIPHKFHSLFLRCLNCKGNHVQAILWACLLLPLSHLNTLVYLMQFLSEVSKQSPVNKMDEANLSIIFTPTLMPVNARKLTAQGGAMINQRMKIIQVLLRNSSKIGVLPDSICERLGLYVSNSFSSMDDLDSSVTRRKRRKKRSSSLNRVISGIKKMITKPSPEADTKNTNFAANQVPFTPKIMSTGKKKCTDSNFSNKKKSMVLRSLPNNTILANTPRKVKYCSTSMLTPRTLVTRPDSNMVVRHNSSAERKRKISHSDDVPPTYMENFMADCADFPVLDFDCDNVNNDEFMSVRKDEFMDIKNRVSLLECKLQNEFDIISLNDRVCSNDDEIGDNSIFHTFENEPMSVDDVFNRTVHESQKISTAHNNDFEIRKTQRAIRSPSARKIGSFRNKRKVSRHSSLNLCDRPSRSRYPEDVYSSKRLRRGRPNTVFSGLPVPSLSSHSSDTNLDMTPADIESTLKLLKNEDMTVQNLEKSCDKWPAARIMNEAASSAECRRSSINFIRQRNAGMVLQKAKLFGDVKPCMADSDPRRNVCVHTPSQSRLVSGRMVMKTPVMLNNLSNLRSPRVYRSNLRTLSNT